MDHTYLIALSSKEERKVLSKIVCSSIDSIHRTGLATAHEILNLGGPSMLFCPCPGKACEIQTFFIAIVWCVRSMAAASCVVVSEVGEGRQGTLKLPLKLLRAFRWLAVIVFMVEYFGLDYIIALRESVSLVIIDRGFDIPSIHAQKAHKCAEKVLEHISDSENREAVSIICT